MVEQTHRLYCGIDLHGNNNFVAVLDEQERTVFKGRLHNHIRVVRDALDPFRKQMVGIVVESTYNWYWLVDGLMDEGYRVHLANTSAIQQYAGIKHTDDESDAIWLARMLRLGILPEGYIYPKEKRAVRDLLRKRSQLVRQRTANILSVENHLARHIGVSRPCAEIKVLKDAEVDRAIGDPNRAMAVKSTVAIIRSLDAQVVLLEKEVLRQTEPDQSFARLSAVSGIGDILAMTIVLETGDLKRFKGVGNYASYCRRVKSMRISNEKRKGANNRKNGNVYLAWAYGEAAMQAIRNNPTIKRYYERKRAKTDAPRAMNAVGHKLARAFFHVMRDGTAFDTERAFGRR